MHFYPIILSFLKTCPYHLNQCRCITVIISSIPSLTLNSLLENLSIISTPHIHLQPAEVSTRKIVTKDAFRIIWEGGYAVKYRIIHD